MSAILAQPHLTHPPVSIVQLAGLTFFFSFFFNFSYLLIFFPLYLSICIYTSVTNAYVIGVRFQTKLTTTTTTCSLPPGIRWVHRSLAAGSCRMEGRDVQYPDGTSSQRNTTPDWRLAWRPLYEPCYRIHSGLVFMPNLCPGHVLLKRRETRKSKRCLLSEYRPPYDIVHKSWHEMANFITTRWDLRHNKVFTA